jgi:hypothetical protein
MPGTPVPLVDLQGNLPHVGEYAGKYVKNDIILVKHQNAPLMLRLHSFKRRKAFKVENMSIVTHIAGERTQANLYYPLDFGL